jgi:adenylosuccinate synthase
MYKGEKIEHYPANLNKLAECEAVYEEFPGWSEDITGVTTLLELPDNARTYLERVSQLTGIPISIFSVGRNREQTNLVRGIYS